MRKVRRIASTDSSVKARRTRLKHSLAWPIEQDANTHQVSVQARLEAGACEMGSDAVYPEPWNGPPSLYRRVLGSDAMRRPDLDPGARERSRVLEARALPVRVACVIARCRPMSL